MLSTRDGQTCFALTADQFAARGLQLIAAGAGFVGGCCDASPESIGAICGKLPS
ncbi:MAG: homocysteine S-methyltransferase family protein [Thermoguttaceae bacterium]